MGANTGRPRKYIVKLTEDEVKYLKSIMRKKKASATQIRRCRIILDMDENHGKFFTEQQIADRLSISRATITNVLRTYSRQGLEAAIKYKRNPNSDNARRKVDGRIEAKIIQIACGPAPEGHARWSLRLLESTLKGMCVELDIPELSDTTIRRTLKKTTYNLIEADTGASRQKTTRTS